MVTSTTDIATANIKFRKLKTDGSGITLPGPYTTKKGNYFINCNEIYADGFGIYSFQGVTYLEINATRISCTRWIRNKNLLWK